MAPIGKLGGKARSSRHSVIGIQLDMETGNGRVATNGTFGRCLVLVVLMFLRKVVSMSGRGYASAHGGRARAIGIWWGLESPR